MGQEIKFQREKSDLQMSQNLMIEVENVFKEFQSKLMVDQKELIQEVRNMHGSTREMKAENETQRFFQKQWSNLVGTQEIILKHRIA